MLKTARLPKSCANLARNGQIYISSEVPSHCLGSAPLVAPAQTGVNKAFAKKWASPFDKNMR